MHAALPFKSLDARAGQSRALIYTGLKRAKNTIAGSRLTIVSSSPDFLDFWRKWPNFHDVSAEGKTGFGVSGR